MAFHSIFVCEDPAVARPAGANPQCVKHSSSPQCCRYGFSSGTFTAALPLPNPGREEKTLKCFFFFEGTPKNPVEEIFLVFLR